MFFVEDIGPITWNDEAFDHLVYDEQQKDLILSFVESHGPSKKQQLEDVIMGKGIFDLVSCSLMFTTDACIQARV